MTKKKNRLFMSEWSFRQKKFESLPTTKFKKNAFEYYIFYHFEE